MAENDRAELIYNSACPVCEAGIQKMRTDRAAYTDIVATPEVLAAHGLTQRDVQYRLHALDREGKLVRGIDAVAVALAQPRRWRWLAPVLRAPGVRQLGWLGYEIVAAGLYRWNRWRGNF